jgi:hypothetical protein
MSVIGNAAISIERIHIRFEDGLSSLSLEKTTKYALGVTLERFTVLPETHDIGHEHVKTAILKDFAIYFKQDEMMETLSREAQKKAFRDVFLLNAEKAIIEKPVATTAITSSSSSCSLMKKSLFPYLLEPLSFEMVLQVHATNEKVRQPVHMGLTLRIPKVDLNMSHLHYTYLSSFLDNINRFDRFSLYRRFRPFNETTTRQNRNWREWWRYAILAILIDCNDPVSKKPTWRRTLNLVFVSLQYTALRRQIMPFLLHRPIDAYEYPAY